MNNEEFDKVFKEKLEGLNQTYSKKEVNKLASFLQSNGVAVQSVFASSLLYLSIGLSAILIPLGVWYFVIDNQNEIENDKLNNTIVIDSVSDDKNDIRNVEIAYTKLREEVVSSTTQMRLDSVDQTEISTVSSDFVENEMVITSNESNQSYDASFGHGFEIEAVDRVPELLKLLSVNKVNIETVLPIQVVSKPVNITENFENPTSIEKGKKKKTLIEPVKKDSEKKTRKKNVERKNSEKKRSEKRSIEKDSKKKNTEEKETKKDSKKNSEKRANKKNREKKSSEKRTSIKNSKKSSNKKSNNNDKVLPIKSSFIILDNIELSSVGVANSLSLRYEMKNRLAFDFGFKYNYHNIQQFKNRKDLLSNFNQRGFSQFENDFRPQDSVSDISLRTTLIQIPINISYNYAINNNWSLRFIGGSAFNIDLTHDFNFKNKPAGGTQSQNQKRKGNPPIINEATLAIGVERRLGNFGINLSPFIRTDLIKTYFHKTNFDYGIQFGLYYRFNK
jgi:hypothetical protein